MIFENNIRWYMYKYLEINNINMLFSSIANLKCAPSDREMYPYGYMYPRSGTPDLN